MIGSGSFGRIYRVLNIQTKEHKALKKLSKSKISNIEKYKEEINILKKMDHPNIIKLHEVYEDKRSLYLITEECTGGTLFERIFNTTCRNKKTLSEKKIATLFKQLIEALFYCHALGICHRDIKPENLLFLNKDDNSPLKLIDFGLGVLINKEAKLHFKAGSPHYVAPEVLEGEYDEKCDIWSAGVILYNLASGLQPFDGKTEAEIYEKIKQGNVCFPPERKSLY